MIVTFFISE